VTRVGTAITGEGIVIFRDCTRYGLQRMCIEQMDRYPDVGVWSEMVGAHSKWLHDYRERLVSGVMVCHLWMFWKE
jgi:hypothetical protein